MPSAGTLRAVRRLIVNRPRSRDVVCLPTDQRFKTAPLQSTGTGGMELTFLGSSSQGGARRYPSSMAMRIRASLGSEVWVFDTGEGALAQMQRSSMRLGLVRNIFVTHLHGDHLYGLPGMVLSVLRSRVGEGGVGVTGGAQRVDPDEGVDVYGPQGLRSFLRMSLGVAGFHMFGRNLLRIHELVWPSNFGPGGRNSRIRTAGYYWKTHVRRLGFEGHGRDIEPVINEGEKGKQFTYQLMGGMGEHDIGEQKAAKVTAAPVLHTVPTYAFSIMENVPPRRFDKRKLELLGIPSTGRARHLFESLMRGETAQWQGRTITAEDVMQKGRLPRKVCIIGDTYDADGAEHIAKDVDVLVHEATNMAAQTSLARMRGHSSTLGATSFAKKVGAKRLILNHTSVAYSDRKLRSMEIEARGMLGANRAFVARDLSVFTVPTCEEDDEEFVFRRFVGFSNSLEYKGITGERDNPFGREVTVDDGEGVEEDRELDDGDFILAESGESEDLVRRPSLLDAISTSELRNKVGKSCFDRLENSNSEEMNGRLMRDMYR